MALLWEPTPLLGRLTGAALGEGKKGAHVSFCENHTLLPDDGFQPRACLGLRIWRGGRGDGPDVCPLPLCLGT